MIPQIKRLCVVRIARPGVHPQLKMWHFLPSSGRFGVPDDAGSREKKRIATQRRLA
jgi:hypothetical protein